MLVYSIMEFDDRYKTSLSSIIKNLDIENDIDLSEKTVRRFWKMIDVAYKRTIEEQICSAATIKPRDASTYIPNGQYIPLSISQYIDTMLLELVVHTCKIGKLSVTIHYGQFRGHKKSLAQIKKIVTLISSWLLICYSHALPECQNNLSLFIYPTPAVKNLPRSSASVIGPDNVNSGFSHVCANDGSFCVFREEELFKVFIHESFHAFGLGIRGHEEKYLSKKIGEMVSIDCRIMPDESYVETWARIMNVMFSCYSKTRKEEDFIQFVHFSLAVEREFSFMQAKKVLSFNNITLNDCLDQESTIAKELYRENTHAFSYYLIVAALMDNMQSFVDWCQNNNKLLFQFNNTRKSSHSFLQLVKQSIEDYEELPLHSNREKGTRMSIVDLR
jgi:hypothetical protein